jgi:hypothetical protein
MNPGWVMEVSISGPGIEEIGVLQCGAFSKFATGSSDEITRILTRLGALKGTWRMEGKRCHRIGCGENAGMYWCNVSDCRLASP